MLKRRQVCWALAVVLVFLVAATGLLVSFLRPTPGITIDNFRLLQVGMSRQAVEDAFGEPCKESYKDSRVQVWRSKDTEIFLVFNQEANLIEGAAWKGRDGLAEEQLQESGGFLPYLLRLLPW